MGTPTYTALANLTLGSSAASVTFSSISQAFRDLVLVVSLKDSSNDYITYRFNGVSTNTYTTVAMTGNGTSATSATNSTISYTGAALAAIDPFYTTSSIATFQIMDYSATDKHKTTLVRANNASIQTVASVSRWASTSAITSITILADSGTYSVGDTLALYGIAA